MIKLVVHCSDSPQGRGDDAETLHRWHLERGWSGIGYHYVILEDGTLQKGRPEFWEGAHARGYNDALGIVLIGDKTFTKEQYSTLRSFIKNKGFKSDEVVGHYQVDSAKTCPNFNVPDFLASI